MATPSPSDSALRAAYEHCRERARRRAANFYVAFAVLPPERRRAFHAVYAYAGLVDDAVDNAGSDRERAAALEDAHRLLDQAYRGAEVGAPPLTVALGDAVRRFGIPRGCFEELVRGMEQDLAQTRYPTADDLDEYCYRAASVIGLICIEIFGYDRSRSDQAVEAAVAMGRALQLTNIMRDVREDAERGRIYLALEDLSRYGVSETDILGARLNAPFRSLMREYARRAYSFYDQGTALLPLIRDTRSRMCCNGLQGVYRTILDAIVSADYDVFSRRVSPSKFGRLAALLRLWIGAAFPPDRRWFVSP